MKWTKNMDKAVKVVKKELEVLVKLNREASVSIACEIIIKLAKKNLIKKEED